MRLVYSFFILSVFFVSYSYSQIPEENLNVIPKVALVTYKLLDMPGINDAKSNWEISYELRIISEKEEYEARKAGKLKTMQDEEKVGVLIGKGTYDKKDLLKKENRQVTFTIPITQEIQERLNDEPIDRINLGKVKITDDIIKKSREDEAKAQVFLIYANAVIYDANLKKTSIIPLSRVMPFARHPNVSFEMTIEISETGSYSTRLILPVGINKDSIKTVKQ